MAALLLEVKCGHLKDLTFDHLSTTIHKSYFTVSHTVLKAMESIIHRIAPRSLHAGQL